MKQLRMYTLMLAGFLFLLLAAPEAKAQKYRFAAGWRFGDMTNGVAVKVVPVQGLAVEGIVNFYPYGPSATLMLERHRPLFCWLRGVQVYGGVGAHYRFYYEQEAFFDPVNGVTDLPPPPGSRGWGLDANLGVELKVPLLPLTLSAELKPNVEFTDARAVMYGLDPGIGVKVAF